MVASVSNPVNRIRKKVHFEDFDANANANADGIKTGTAWAAADDGMLVWDRNGNGSIDSGRELFGDETILANGQKAANGFAALAELDTGSLVNGIIVGAGDGKFDAKDAQYANLRVWRDLNQDGISQAGELQTLAQRRVQGGFIRAFAPISLDSAIKPTASSIAIKSKATCARRLSVSVGFDVSSRKHRLHGANTASFKAEYRIGIAVKAFIENGRAGAIHVKA